MSLGILEFQTVRILGAIRRPQKTLCGRCEPAGDLNLG